MLVRSCVGLQKTLPPDYSKVTRTTRFLGVAHELQTEDVAKPGCNSLLGLPDFSAL